MHPGDRAPKPCHGCIDIVGRVSGAEPAPAKRHIGAFEHLGLQDLANEAKLLSRAQNWEALPKLISDDILDKFAVIDTYDKVGKKLVERFGKVVTNSEFSIPVRNEAEREALAGLVKDIQSSGEDTARATIKGKAG